MSKPAIQFESVELHRVMGVTRSDSFSLTGLSPGVNLVHGPNGSGKSTTSRALQELLWPGRTGLSRPSVAGWLSQDGSRWRVEIDAGHPEVRAATRDAGPLEIGPPEHRSRYCLALHELIGTDDHAFAQRIAEESLGGVNLDAAAEALDFQERPSSPRRLASLLASASQAVQEARSRQQGIDDRARGLTDLEARLEKAQAAAIRAERLTRAIEIQHARLEVDKHQRTLAELPKAIEELRGDERATLDELDRQASAWRERRREIEGELKAGQAELAALELPDEPVDLANLRGGQRRLAAVEAELRQRQEEAAGAEAAAEKARRRLGDQLTDEQLAGLETVEMEPMSAFARKVEAARAKAAAIEAMRQRLDREAPDEPVEYDADQLRRGAVLLGQWMATPAPPSPMATAEPQPRSWLTAIVGAALLVVLTVIAAATVHPAWWLGLLAAAVVIGVELWLGQAAGRRSPRAPVVEPPDVRAAHRRSYEQTGLPAPEAWEEEPVNRLMERLFALQRRWDAQLQQRRDVAALEQQRAAVEKEQQALAAERDALEERLGLKLTSGDGWLGVLIDNLSAWQHASLAAAQAMGRARHLRAEAETLRDAINQAMRRLDLPEVHDAAAAALALEALTDRLNQRDRLRQAIATLRRELDDTVTPGLDRARQQRQGLFERLGLDADRDDADATLDGWLGQRDAWVTATDQLKSARAIVDNLQAALTDHPELLEQSTEDLQHALDQATLLADERERLAEQITQIRTQIDDARSRHDLSDALATVDGLTAELADARDEAQAKVAGAVLARWVREAAVDRSRPAVFQRASEKLARFTHGALSLRLDDQSQPPRFLAQRGSQPPAPVEQLSVGERVQLLMAVRLAFIEQHEPAPLPLLLDEALGTSDDGRAGVIIDAIIEIAREGRQVFYFTAQHDEVGKWIARLNAGQVDHQVFDLARERRLEAASRSPLVIARVEATEPPAPEGMDHAAYGEALRAPGVDPASDDLSRLHLWHVVDDVNLLHDLLRRRINTWGQLETLLKHNGAGLVDGADQRLEKVKDAAEAARTACEAWRVGRVRPMSREALEDCGAVTDNFLGPLAEVLAEHEGDGEALMRAVENGDVPRWRRSNTDPLREYMVEHGYLVQTPRLTPEAIRLRVLAASAPAIREGRLTEAWVQRFVDSLPA